MRHIQRLFCFLITPVLGLVIQTSQAQTAVNNSGNTGVGYFLEYRNDNAISVHVSALLTEGTVEVVYFKPDGKVDMVSRQHLPKFMLGVADSTALKGLDSIFVDRYRMSLFKTSDASWEPILAAVENLLSQLAMSSVRRLAPEPRDLVCNETTPFPTTAPKGKVTYAVRCPPNPDMLEIQTNVLITPIGRYEKWNGWDNGLGNKDFEVRTDLITDLKKMEGLTSIYAREGELSLQKGAAFSWTALYPRIINIISADLGWGELVQVAPSKTGIECCPPIRYRQLPLKIGGYDLWVEDVGGGTRFQPKDRPKEIKRRA